MNRSHYSTLFCLVVVATACGGESATESPAGGGGSSGAGGSAQHDPKACPRVCNKLVSGQCGFNTSSDCGQQCVPHWQECPQWPALLACIDAHPIYDCAGAQPPPCAAEMSAVLGCSADAGPALVDCVPGAPLPPCSCDGGQASGGLCPPKGKTAPCCG
jgi:hypothetical protein